LRPSEIARIERLAYPHIVVGMRLNERYPEQFIEVANYRQSRLSDAVGLLNYRD